MTKLMTKATCVVVDGPFADADRHGEEIPVWSVSVEDDDGGQCAPVQQCSSYAAAMAYGRMEATRRRVELVIEAMDE